MACNTELLNVAPKCGKLKSEKRRLGDLLILLAQAVNKIDGAFTVNWTTIRANTATAAICVKPEQAREKAAEVIESGLVGADPTIFDCLTAMEMEQLRVFLTCKLVTAINP